MATFSINASSLRKSPVAPPPPAPVSAPVFEEAPSSAALRRTSSSGTANSMSIDGGIGGDEASSAATATAESGRSVSLFHLRE